jgi:plasmid stabilization system protein ParE
MSSVPLHVAFGEGARADIVEIGFYFAQRNKEVENRFYQAIDQTLRLLADAPELGERYSFCRPELAGMRVWRVKYNLSYSLHQRECSITLF